MQQPRTLGVPWTICLKAAPNLNDDNAWPELGAGSQQKEGKMKENGKDKTVVATSSLPAVHTECRLTDTLEHLHFPELGAKAYGIKYYMHASAVEAEGNGDQVAMDTGKQSRKKCRMPLSPRRLEQIYIELNSIIENAIYLRSLRYSKRIRSEPNQSACKNSYTIKKFRGCVIKLKKLPKLKPIIPLDRDARAQINVQERRLFDAEKYDAISRDVNAINIDALKITSDSEVDMDYTKRMSELSFYDKCHRRVGSGSSSGPNPLGPELIDRLTRLNIRKAADYADDSSGRAMWPSVGGRKFFAPEAAEERCRIYEQEDGGEAFEKRDDTADDNKEPTKHSRNFREYCTNTLTPSLNEHLEKFLCGLRRLQRKLYERNAQKGRHRRRYYCGIKEVQRRVDLKKVKFVVIAPDLEKAEQSGGLDDRVNVLLESCRKFDVVVCFALRRRKLGYHMHGRGFVGCVGVANYGGLEELFKNVLVELVKAKNDFNERNGKPEKVVDLNNLIPEDYLLSEGIRHLMKLLTSIG